MRWKTVPEVGA